MPTWVLSWFFLVLQTSRRRRLHRLLDGHAQRRARQCCSSVGLEVFELPFASWTSLPFRRAKLQSTLRVDRKPPCRVQRVV